ncbi:MAG: hypothetical protein M1837_005804 [Sclerophora amabilis]|nr:MAG: hypothetical protein M1837_005804 [Sclerophora amabilis]
MASSSVSTRAPADASTDSDGEDLSDTQIQQLLKDAEQRLRARSISRPDEGNDSHDSIVPVTSTRDSKTSHVKIPRLNPGQLPQPYVRSTDDIARVNSSRILNKEERQLANQPRRVEDPVKVKEQTQQNKKATAGSDWFNMPRTKLTPELKRDLQLLQMRSVLDPKRHYKKSGSTRKFKAPEYSQMGTVVEGPTEFYSARIPNKERKQTFVEEVLSKEDTVRKFKNKFHEIRASKASGKKEFYKNLKAKRSGPSKYR